MSCAAPRRPQALGAIVQPNSVDANSEAALATINTINKWIGVVVIVLAVCMNMSAVDSLQNGLTAAISSHFLKGRPVAWTKVAVVLINVPLIVLGALPKSVVDLKVLDLFLLANMLCCTSAIPVLSGLSARLHNLIGGGSVVFAGLFSIFCTSCERLRAAPRCACAALPCAPHVDIPIRRAPPRHRHRRSPLPCCPLPVPPLEQGTEWTITTATLTPSPSQTPCRASTRPRTSGAGPAGAPPGLLPSLRARCRRASSHPLPHLPPLCSSALNYTWMGNGYSWDFFLVSAGSLAWGKTST